MKSFKKQFKLRFHQKNFSEEPLVFNSADLPDVKQNDLLKVNACDENASDYLLVQVKTLKDGLPKDTVSVEQTFANSFGLKVFQDVYIVQVETEEVTIDLLEVAFKDQYISRSDMWRMKKDLVNSCTYLDQYLQYSDIRAQVSELWVNSSKAKCGYISDSTNVVLRSFTAKVYVFIQMSMEMWDYDAYGYLQFERAVNGFLKALFTKWKEKKCCHELTLVLFSRTFYETKDIGDFPDKVQASVRKNYRGQLYLDFYKCVVQTEKLEDCTPLLTQLKVLFHNYDQLTQIPGCPKGRNSTSSEGNFLEAINMSLNVFEQHNINRNFDGTGQIVVCITPGVGVFDVDRDLTILTKERMIDNGIGSDLICLGQHPLHAVPLFKFHHKPPDWLHLQNSSVIHKISKTFSQPAERDFNIPHWINHSFYTSNPFTDKGSTNIKYIPRIHAPLKPRRAGRRMPSPFSSKHVDQENDELPSVQQISYADHDKQIFGFHKPSPSSKETQKQNPSTKRSVSENMKKKIPNSTSEAKRSPTRPVHIPFCGTLSHMKAQEGMASSLGAAGHFEKLLAQKQKENLEVRPVIGSATTSRSALLEVRKTTSVSRRALFNPFNPALMFAPLTANRRRWVHTYPRGPQGEALVLHHRNSSSFPSRAKITRQDDHVDEDPGLTLPLAVDGMSPHFNSNLNVGSPYSVGFSTQHTIQGSFDESSCTNMTSSVGSNTSLKGTPASNAGFMDPSPAEGFASSKGIRCDKPISSYGLSWMWGIAGDIQWTPETYTGLDWKSLKCPACLPITTDYSPQQAHLQSRCTEQGYTIVPDEINYSNDGGNISGEQTKMRHDSSEKEGRSSMEIFLELINQRLCHGFQIIKLSKRMRTTDSSSSCATLTSPNASEGSFRSFAAGSSPFFTSSFGTVDSYDGLSNVYMLSHGRQYHILRLSTDEDKIDVKIFKPKHPSATVTVQYSYMLWPKTRAQFQVAMTSFAHEKVEDYYWNHLDIYVCDPDDNHFQINQLKSWRTKFVTLAAPAKRLRQLKAANEGNREAKRYDVFEGCGCTRSHETCLENGECAALTEGFVRFLEHLNKFKRKDQNSRKSWKSFASFSGNLSKSYPVSSSSCVHGSNQATPTPPTRPTSSTPTSERSTPVRSITDTPPAFFSGSLMHGVDAQPVPIKSTKDIVGTGASPSSEACHLSTNSEMSEIITAMKNLQSGLSFFPEQTGLPKYTFISLEAVHWAIDNIEEVMTIKEACAHFERMRSYGLIAEVSREGASVFRYGYHLYNVKDKPQNFELEDPTSYQYHSYVDQALDGMQNRWFEVSIKRSDVDEDSDHHHLSSNLDLPHGKSGAFYVTPRRAGSKAKKLNSSLRNKVVKMILQNKLRNNRTEWCQIKHSSETRAGMHTFIFCFELQWMVATATSLFNLLQTWFREAQRCDLYFCPVPLDPFAFPSTGVTGPLRSPLFVPLNLKDLDQSSVKFQEYKQNGDIYRNMIIEFMEAILMKFGFLRDLSHDEGIDQSKHNSVPQNYIHCTGQVLAQIPIHSRTVQRNSVSFKSRVGHNLGDHASRPSTPNCFEAGFAVTQAELDGTGFYWSFNYMQTKRWRTAALDDCPPADLERDFVQFCSNSDLRLFNIFENFITSY